MAIEVGELLVSIKTDLSDMKKGLEDANAKIADFGAGTVAKGNLIAMSIEKAGKMVLQFGMDSIKAYGESQEAVTRLELALKNSGQEVEQTSKKLQANATALQKLTGVSDEAIIATQTMLTTFDLAGEELDRTTMAALDLSKGLGIDLRTATLMLGKAAAGETGTLARYGIVIDESVPKAKKFDAVLAQVNTRFGGQAQANVEGVNGKLAVLSERINDAQEMIGKQLVPALDFWGKALGKLLDQVERMTGAQTKEAQGRALTIKSLEEQRQAIIKQAQARANAHDGVVRLTQAETDRLNLITKALQNEKSLLKDQEKIEDKKADAVKSRVKTIKRFEAEELKEKQKKQAKEKADLDAQTRALLGKHQTYAQQMLMLRARFNEQDTALLQAYLTDQEMRELNDHLVRLEANKQFADARQLQEQTLRDAEQRAEKAELDERKKRNADRVANFRDTLNFIASLASEKNKVLAAIGKAAAISTATIDTFAAANKALASAPPPFNFGLAAAVTAAGIVNVAKISGIKLAQGGVVKSRDGGTSAIMGEAGKDEAVLPLGDKRTTKMLSEALAGAGAGGGRNLQLTFNISGNFIEADKAKFQRMLRTAVIPEIRRFSEVSPKSSFNRRRGQA